ncbi:methylated-DNA-[protein]-cysteine S-methyltransferase [Prosthecobacter fusiformis]|uniref:Methylated-DNA--protein-cysteine methyltransferase n=1 Tax=Prosthecobacter fusiformis TaxID=48464 RepID=A0A4R7SNJ4_9BACT|nr:methylated-DNA--[protein]-cysteine S-methyltransferase [Prosthecobacter fusiformis]TDU80740.1 methylated-DNA-[protein]-cysteine S-methyltransferase [Prosthecobacter fusiformis]
MTPVRYFTQTSSPIGPITLVATDAGLSGLYLEGQRHWPRDAETWKREDDGTRFDPVLTALARYFMGKSFHFDLPLDFVTGTPFQQQVWQALKLIPAGQTWTYSQLAAHVNAPAAVRAVGAAVGRNPLSIIIPCHRVIGGNGSLTGYAGGLERKRWLLAHEGWELPVMTP